MNTESLIKQYKELLPLYIRAEQNTKKDLEQFLKDDEIPFLVITSRVKSYDSFFEKVYRKRYSNPFEDNEDFCGVRIILYYQADINRVDTIIKNNYDLQVAEDKIKQLQANAFGYRSNHSTVKIKESWCVTPIYKDLENIKIEIQVRTVLMHAWAEIEHELGYKSKEFIPPLIRRKFSQLSAILENTDSQFQEIKFSSYHYKKDILDKSLKSGIFKAKDLNLETLQSLLAFYFPYDLSNPVMESALLNNIILSKLSIIEVSSIAKKVLPFRNYIEKSIKEEGLQIN